MRCKDFIALYSDFRDGTITDPSMERRMRRHKARCNSCARYDKALDLGASVLRQLDVEPSPRFRVNLRVRMALANRRRSVPPVFGWPAKAAATALVVTGIAYGFTQRNDGAQDQPPTRVASATSGTEPSQTGQNPLGSPQFALPAFHQPVGRNVGTAAPRVTFFIADDSGFQAVRATFAR